MESLGLETYLKFQLKIHAQSPALCACTWQNCIHRNQVILRWLEASVLDGDDFFLLVDVVFFCGRYARKRMANCTYLGIFPVPYVRNVLNFHYVAVCAS